MYITLTNSLIDKLHCYLSNRYELSTQKHWNSRTNKVTCYICNKELRSLECEYSPEQCGWMKVKNKTNLFSREKPFWICHTCNSHHNEVWFRKD